MTPPVHTLVLPCARPSVGQARRFVADELAGRLDDDTVQTAVLLLSEVVTNAVLHADGDSAVEVAVAPHVPDGVVVAVRDASTRRPVRRTASAESLGGRGLELVEGLADGYGVLDEDAGKTVWFSLGAVAPLGPVGW